MKGGFTTFLRKQGVVGLAVGFILGGAISKVVSSLVIGNLWQFSHGINRLYRHSSRSVFWRTKTRAG